TARFIARFIDFPIPLARPHFLMSRTHFRLALALIASVLFHLAPLVGELLAPTAERSAPPPPSLTAELRPPSAPQAPLMLPEPPPPKAAEPKPVNSQAKPDTTRGRPRSWQEEVRKQFQQQNERGLYYPAEAIARGLEGE